MKRVWGKREANMFPQLTGAQAAGPAPQVWAHDCVIAAELRQEPHPPVADTAFSPKFRGSSPERCC